MYRFSLRATHYDREGYYFPNWDRAQKIEVVAATRQDAYNEAAKVLGPTGRRGRNWTWTFKIDAIAPAEVTR